MTEQGQSTRVSRRTIAKGAAWAVPVVPLAVATPAYAQSGCVPTLKFSEGSCRCTGEGQNDKDYYVEICNEGTECPDTDGTLYVSIRANTGPEPKEKFFAEAIAVPVGGCSGLVEFNSSNSSLKIRFYYGPTAADANAVDNPNYVVVDAPNDCNDLPPEIALGECIQG